MNSHTFLGDIREGPVDCDGCFEDGVSSCALWRAVAPRFISSVRISNFTIVEMMLDLILVTQSVTPAGAA